MRALKVLVAILAALAAYRAVQVLVLGIPLDPPKALAEWAVQVRSERPQGVSPGTALTKVDFRWEESNSIWFGEGLKEWTETYELSGAPGQRMDPAEKDRIVQSICNSRHRRKVFALGMPVTARILGPGKHDQQHIAVTKTLCTAKAL